MIFDWENYWALEYACGPHKDLTYVDQIHRFYKTFYDQNIAVDMIPTDADFSRYKMVVAPVLYMVKAGMQEALEAYVANGGVLVTGFMSGIVDETDNVHMGGYPGPLRKLAGIWAEEIDALAPDQTNTIRFADGTESEASFLCDILHLEGAESLVDYTSNFYAGSPVVTKNTFGKGSVYYVGSQLTAEAMDKLLIPIAQAAGVNATLEEPTRLEVTRRIKDGKAFTFIMNLTAEPQPMPKAFENAVDILTGNILSAGKPFASFETALIVQ